MACNLKLYVYQCTEIYFTIQVLNNAKLYCVIVSSASLSLSLSSLLSSPHSLQVGEQSQARQCSPHHQITNTPCSLGKNAQVHVSVYTVCVGGVTACLGALSVCVSVDMGSTRL